jgi:hypothetical protein
VLLGWYRRLSDFLFGLFPCPGSCVAVFDDFACIVSFFFFFWANLGLLLLLFRILSWVWFPG